MKVEPWAWVVLAASFCSMFVNSSFFAVGVIHVALLEEYPDIDVSTIAWMGSLFSSMFALTGFLGSIIINIFNVRVCVMLSGLLTLTGFALSSLVTDHRLLFITYSIIAGSGQALSFAGSMVVLGYYFGEKTSIASGIATSGCGLCTFVFPPLTQYFIDVYGIRGAFLLLGGLGFQSAICGVLMRPTKYENFKNKNTLCLKLCRQYSGETSDRIKLKTEVAACFLQGNIIIFTSAKFWLLLISSAAFHFSLSCVYLFLPDYFIHSGSSAQEAAMILSLTGFTGILSRVLLGFLAASVDTNLVFGGTFGIMGVITLLIKFMTTLGSKITYTALFGFYTGASWALQYTLMFEIVGLYDLSTAYGIVMFVSGIGYMTGPPFAEMVVMWFKDYYYAFVCAGVSFIIASLSGLLIKVMNKDNVPETVNEIEMNEKELVSLDYYNDFSRDNIEDRNAINEQSALMRVDSLISKDY